MKRTLEQRKRMSEAHKGHRHSEETKKKMSAAAKGKKKKPFSEEHRRKIGLASKGRKQSKESNKKRSEKLKGRVSPTKGMKHSEETKKKMSLAHKGKSFITDEQRLAISKAQKGRRRTSKEKENLRLIRLKQIAENYNCIPQPNYNKKACEAFKAFDNLNNTKGRYAVYGNGEKQIRGYFVDYFNESLKLIIEIDEKHHFDKLGRLRERDVRRQKEIQRYYSDFKFLRFKDGEMNKILKAGSNNER